MQAALAYQPENGFVRTKPAKGAIIREALLDRYAIEAELCRRSLARFIQTMWPEIANDELVWNWHMDYLCEQLTGVALDVSEGRPRRHDIVINIPPGTTKSTICSIMFPAWCWTRWHWMKFIATTYSGALSLEHAESSRDVVRSDRFRKLFPDITVKRDKDIKSNFRVQKRLPNGVVVLGGNRYSTSVGGTLTGFHGHILIVDDPLNPAGAWRGNEIDTANKWLSQTLSTRKVEKAVTPTILIMQRLHQNDPSGHLLAKKKNILHISLPGEIRNFSDKVKPSNLTQYYIDGLLDPNRMSWDVLKDMEADLGQYGYAGQIGQNPVPPGGGMFKPDNIQAVHAPTSHMMGRPVRYYDKAGTHKGGAFTVGVKMVKLRNGKYHIMDVRRGQWGTDEREQIIKATAEMDGKSTIIYMEQEPGSGGKDSIRASIKNLDGFSVYADVPRGDKVFRADPFSVQVNIGNVEMMEAPWNNDFIDEMRFFPKSTYKDQVDAASGAYSKLRKPTAGVW